MSKEAELVITRVINASKERIWKAFSDPEYIKHWWGPNGFTNTIHEMHFKVGGVWRYTMHGPDGTDYPNRITYEVLHAPSRMEYRHDSDSDTDPDHFRSIVTLEDENGKTRVTLRMVCKDEVMKHHIEKHGAKIGGEQHLARLEQYVTKH